MDVVGKETRFATGRSEADGGAGDSSVLTAFGVFQGMRASAEHLWGSPTLAGRTVGVAGVGKVGRLLTAHLIEDGAHVVVTDVNEQAVDGAARRPTRRWTWHRTPRRWSRATSTSTPRAPSAAPSTRRRSSR